MDARFDKLDEKLDRIGSDISDIKIVQAEQAKDLKYHIRRTDLIEEQLLPLVSTRQKVDGAFKLIGMIGSGLGLVFAAVKALEVLLKFL